MFNIIQYEKKTENELHELYSCTTECIMYASFLKQQYIQIQKNPHEY